MVSKINKQQRNPATFNLRMIKNRQETDSCPTRECCVNLWGDEERFCSIRDLTKFELIHKKDQFIYKMDDPVTSLYIIQSGAVKLEKKVEGGVNHVSGFYFAGEMIGLESVGHEQYQYNAIALKDTWVCEIRLHKLTSLGKSAVAIQKRIGTLLGWKLCEMDKHLYNTRYLHIEQRLLSFLKGVCTKKLTQIDDDLDLYELPIKKEDIANYLGMRPESVSRALQKLEGQGFVKNRFSRKRIIIDKKKLLPGKIIASACVNGNPSVSE